MVFTRSEAERKSRRRKRSRKKWKRSDSSDSESVAIMSPPAYDTDHSFRFSLGHKHSHDSAYDSAYDPASVGNENHPLVVEHLDK